jgi:hypothetical protein
MKKKALYIFIFLLIVVRLLANDFTIEKIHEFGFAQSFIYGGSLQMDYPYIYGMTSHGLEIYHIDENMELEKISMVPIRAPYHMKIKDNYVYISNLTLFESNDGICKLYQIDTSDKYHPVIADSLVFSNHLYISGLELFGNQLYFGLSPGAGFVEEHVYSIPNLEFICYVDTDLFLEKANDSLAIDYYNSSGGANFYDVSDMTNIQCVGGQDFGTLNPSYCHSICDSVVFSTNQNYAMIWDISDEGNWELMSQYVPQNTLEYGNNFIIFEHYALLMSSSYLEIVDISDYYSINIVDTACTYSKACATAYCNNNIFVGTRDEGIQRYKFEDEMLTYEDNYFEYPSYWTSYAYGDYLFAQTWRYGVYLFDISNPEEPQELPTILRETYYKELRGYKNYVWVIDVRDYSYRIYDISDPTDPILRNIIPIGDYYQVYWSGLHFDGENLDEVYIFYISPTKLEKYDISMPGTANLLFEYTGANGYSFVVKDEIGYVTNEMGNFQELVVLGGLAENDPFILEYYPSFLSGGDDGFLQLVDDYLCTRNKPTKFFDLNDPYNPEYNFKLEYPASSGRLRNFENLIFGDIGLDSYIYDLSSNRDDVLYSIDMIKYYTYLQDMSFYKTDEDNYLFAVEESAIEVYEFSYDVGIDPEPEELEQYFTCYPNPFTNSTKFSFSLTTDYHELTQINIYNVKGQLVRKLGFSDLDVGFSAEWDGKDTNGNDVKSGVYFYKLSGNDKHIGKVVKLN